MTFILGLTGSIGMGKSTTARMFADLGCAVWDADAAVHRLYAPDGAAVDPLRSLYPDAVDDHGVNRTRLKEIISAKPSALKAIESVVHPLVAQDRAAFRDAATADIIVFDIPLLFETGAQDSMDAVAVVSVPADIQEQRVMARKTMTADQFHNILDAQMPDAEKRRRADFIIITDTLDHAREQVTRIVADIRQGVAHA